MTERQLDEPTDHQPNEQVTAITAALAKRRPDIEWAVWFVPVEQSIRSIPPLDYPQLHVAARPLGRSPHLRPCMWAWSYVTSHAVEDMVDEIVACVRG